MNDLANNPQGGADAPAEQELATQPQIDETVVNAEDQAADPETDDTEEVEHEGQKYKIPKPLKSALLFHADYTRKTQEVAEQRKGLTAREAELRQQAETQTAFLNEIVELETLKSQVKVFESWNWPEIRRTQGQDAADQLWFSYQQTLIARNNAQNQYDAKASQRSQAAADTAKRASEEAEAVLRRDIKDWSPDTRGKVAEFLSREFSVSPDEIATVTNPTLWKLAHRAYLGDQAIKKAAKAAAAAKTAATAEGVKPVTQVGSNASSAAKVNLASKEAERIDADEWTRRRNQELRNRA